MKRYVRSFRCKQDLSYDPESFLLAWFKGRCFKLLQVLYWGWSGGAMVHGKLQVPGRSTIWMVVGQGPIALAVGAGGGCLDIFTLLYPFFSSISLSQGDDPI